MEYIFAFRTTNFAIKSEQLLLAASLDVKAMPLPGRVRAGCGICLRVASEEVRRAVSVLAEHFPEEIHLFSRVETGGKYKYTAVDDINAV